MRNRATRMLTRRRRSAFTMIEILIVIGVIVVLMTIGFVGYRSLEASGSKKQAYSTLTSAEGLLRELSAAGAASRIEGPGPNKQSPEPVFAVPELPAVASPIPNPGDVNTGKTTRTTFMNDAAQKRVMTVLLGVPANKKAVQGMPSAMIVPPDPSVTPPVPYNPTRLADPWTNPIMLVPSAGLAGVKTEAEPAGVTIKNPNGRPFWVSAGPDGLFDQGDDNLYSFDK